MHALTHPAAKLAGVRAAAEAGEVEASSERPELAKASAVAELLSQLDEEDDDDQEVSAE